MTWTKLSDDYGERLELAQVSRSARHLLTELYCWANKNLTDGHVPAHRPSRISDSPNLAAEVEELERAELIKVTAAGDLQLDWSDQEPADVVRARQEKGRTKKATQRRCAAGLHDQCPDTWKCRKDGDVPEGQAKGRATPPTRPNQSRPEGAGTGLALQKVSDGAFERDREPASPERTKELVADLRRVMAQNPAAREAAS